jgi:hypothetical protein
MTVAKLKLSVLQGCWGVHCPGSASRKCHRLAQQAAKLGGTPYNQAQQVKSIVQTGGPLLAKHGMSGLIAVLKGE